MIGLTQGEAFARYEALTDISRAIPNLNETLNDLTTLTQLADTLMYVSVGDERRENRIKAFYLLGQVAAVLGNESRYSDLTMGIFKHLAKMIVERQCAAKVAGGTGFEDIRMHLIRAIGKVKMKKVDGIDQECLILYMIHEELKTIFENDKRAIEDGAPDLFVLLAIMDLLNSNVF